MHDLAAELSALRERVAKLESVVTFRVNPDTGKEVVMVRCGTLMCDRLRIDGGKASQKEGVHVRGGIWMECDDGMPSIVLDHFGEDRCQRSVMLGFDDQEMPELSVNYAGKGGVQIGLNEHLAGDIRVQDPMMRDTIHVRATPHGGALLIRGQEGDARLTLDYTRLENEDGSVKLDAAALRLYRKGAIPAASVSMHQEGDSLVELNGTQGKLQAAMRTKDDATVLLLTSPTSPAGVVIATAGDLVHAELCQNVDEKGHGRVALTCGADSASARLVPGPGKPNIDLHASAEGASVNCCNGDGKGVASMNAYKGDIAAVNLNRPGGDNALALTVVKDTPSLHMVPLHAVQPSVMLSTSEKQTNLIVNREGRPLVHIQGTDEGGVISVNTTLDANNMRATMGASKEGAAVQISTMDGTPLASMHGHTYGGALTLSSELGFPRVMAMAHEDMGMLQLDCSGTIGIKAVATPQGGAVILCDPEGKPMSTLPPDMIEGLNDDDD